MNNCKGYRLLVLLGALLVLVSGYGCSGGGSSGTANNNNSTSVAAPTLTPTGGTFGQDQTVALQSSTTGATIYYTMDGSTPTTSSMVYSAPIPVSGNGTSLTIRALAIKNGLADSTVSSGSFAISYSTVATPTLMPAAGTYHSDQTVTLQTATTGASIYYTTDGSTPTTSSTLYSDAAPIAVSGNGTSMTIKAIAVKSGLTTSAAASATYAISYLPSVATPTFTPSGGSYSGAQSVTIQCATAGATIYYTTDGTLPTTASTVYTAPVAISGTGTTTFKAFAVLSGVSSTVASATYSINAPASIFSYPLNPQGGLIQSSMVYPNGSDNDMYAYKDFTLGSDQSISEVKWRGGYLHNATFGKVLFFTITFFDSIPGGTQPLVTRPDAGAETYLAKYTTSGNAAETAVAGSSMYDYDFVLPTPFAATAGKKYWIRIEGEQGTYSDWAIAAGTGGDGRYYRFATGAAQFSFGVGDTSFTLK
ncbi:chitobiase/beta-hexosaminidase C-terminal domain-containing protein [Geomesophilobacter sediminis]|uniref:Chitobiase/beta-hexosaminidase C-terminal domain-containing protein n=1 Tax=Geomesophilobacter sediminis TaxID=2798584 RepID=A0A8J7M0M6_9BACT|nr:chitobiase/beta-hexosaminidase C-terminal domain-containing protein [Geomesophilobacter sediminis]MBJ6725982.1 chitobiase/beta-hexosaminidase C-terminal domain-containing protein [Geomesophilobacter sediminis]